MKNEKLKGENIRPRNNQEARKLIGKRVEYLVFNSLVPKIGTIAGVKGRNIAIGEANNFVLWLPDVMEMRIIEDE